MPKKIITVFYIGPECGFKSIQGSTPDHINVITSKPEIKSVSKKIKYAHAFIDASMKIPINQKILRLAKIFNCDQYGLGYASFQRGCSPTSRVTRCGR